MAKELAHGSVGVDLSQTEWEGLDTHTINGGVVGDLLYVYDGSGHIRGMTVGATGSVLTVVAGLPAWASTVTLTLSSPTLTGQVSSTGLSHSPGVGSDGALIRLGGTIIEAVSGIHAKLTGLEITAPTITDNAAAVTNTATVYISGSMTTTVTGTNYALWVDAGTVQFDSSLNVGSTLTVQAGGLVVTAGGVIVSAGGLQVTAGNLGLAGAVDSGIGLNIPATMVMTTRADQYGIYSGPTFDQSATTSATAVYAQVQVANSSFTMTNAYGVYVKNMVKGASATVTNQYGVYIEAPTGAATNNISLYVAGATTLAGVLTLSGGMTVSSGTTTVGTLIVKPTGAATSSAGSIRMEYNSSVQFRNSGNTGDLRALLLSGTTITLGDTFTSTTVANGLTITTGNLGISASPVSHSGIYIAGSTLTSSGNASYGIISSPVHPSTSTGESNALHAFVVTAASAFTVNIASGLQIAAPQLGAGSAITDMRGIRVKNQGLAGVTNAYGIYIEAQSGAATTNIGLYNAGSTQLVGRVGVGGAPGVNVGVFMTTATALSGASSQYGYYTNPLFGSAATAQGISYYALPQTTAAAYTMGSAVSFYAANPVKGAGSAITNSYGTYVEAMTAGSGSNYGVYILAPSGGSIANIGLYNAGTTRLDGNLGIGTAAVSYVGIYQTATLAQSGGSAYGYLMNATWPTGTTGNAIGIQTSITTAVAAFTVSVGTALYVSTPALGAGSAITTNRGVYVTSQGASGVTNAYGVYIEAQSGAATTNIGLYNAGTTTLIGNVTLGNGSVIAGAIDWSLQRGGANLLTLTASGLVTPSTVFIGGSAARSTTQPTNSLNLYDGTAPVGTLANGITLYSSAGELRVMDSGGVSTLLSPHDDDGYWVFDSTRPDGSRLRIDVEKLLRAVNDKLGYDFIHEFAVGGIW